MNKSELRKFIKDRAILKGDSYTLSSGRTTSYYIDSKKFLLHPQALCAVAEQIKALTESWKFQAVGGMETGAIPLAAACSLSFQTTAFGPVEGFYVRKKHKPYGAESWIEGVLQPGSSVLIVEDVITTGSSVLKVIRRVEALDCKVVGVVAVIDRLQGASYKLWPKYPYESLFTVKDFGIDPLE